jgi:hypothetical protein
MLMVTVMMAEKGRKGKIVARGVRGIIGCSTHFF